MDTRQQVANGGMSLGGVLFVVFLVLRLTDNIDWAWYWVASPLWIPFGLALLFAIGFGIVVGAIALFEKLFD